MYDYFSNFEELSQHCELVANPSITIDLFVRGVQTNLKGDVWSPLDEAYHKACGALLPPLGPLPNLPER